MALREGPEARLRMRSALLPGLLCILAGLAAPAFTLTRRQPGSLVASRGAAGRGARRTARAAGDAFLQLESKESGLAPEFLLHWGHGLAMGTVLLAMGGYGTFLGWQTRLGNGDAVYPLSVGQAARSLHPLLMGLALFFFVLGGQGGLVLLATAGKPILQSAHSSTAVLGLGLMAAQAALGVTMGDSETKRTVHAFLGTGVMLLLLVTFLSAWAWATASEAAIGPARNWPPAVQPAETRGRWRAREELLALLPSRPLAHADFRGLLKAWCAAAGLLPG
eukprot:CAMPEP_0168503152 /NCGR_PEP_ID=MMETSP0228-20121227/75699_1 /TAXON_ID=133427 /ORGANISM="Protoceratium reticulatum, Strain CCCM 535 (=CCMP 1889)" /LENGTH=277 /DNA_ID=CAMNT_0008520181 /DNA_START=71 /DNA_END=901 /DNA_ORIENTATION=+